MCLRAKPKARHHRRRRWTALFRYATRCRFPVRVAGFQYALPVSQTKGHAEQHAHEGLTATVVWLRSVQWLDSVGLVGVGLVGVGFVGVGLVGVGLVGVGLVGIDTRKSACGSGLVGVGLWALACGRWLVRVGL